jgi:hypothetical protein
VENFVLLHLSLSVLLYVLDRLPKRDNHDLVYNNNKKHFKKDLSSIRKYDDAVEIFIKDCIRTSGFMYDTFENYFEMKLDYMERQLENMEEAE